MRLETVQSELMDSLSTSPGLIVRSPGGGLGRSSLISRKAGAGISLGSNTRSKKLRIVTTVTKKENNQAGPKSVDKSNQLRRSKRATSLSDRWPVLNRLMRSRHVEHSPPSSESSNADSSSDSSEDEDEEGTLTLQSANKVIVHIPSSKPRYLHTWSPRRSSPLSDLRRKPGMQGDAKILRHCYPHRGYSLSSFYNIKQLWIQRRYEWDQYEIEVETWRLAHAIELEDGELDSTLPPHLVGGPQRSELATSYAPANTSVVPAYSPISENSGAIFPRLGDLSAVRDSFLISVDVWFAHFPPWTIAKLTWSYDLTHRALSTMKMKPSSSESTSESGISSSKMNQGFASRSSDFCIADASTEVVSPSSTASSTANRVISFSTDIDEMSDSILINSFPLPDVSRTTPFMDGHRGLLEGRSLNQVGPELHCSNSSLSSSQAGICPCCHLENTHIRQSRSRAWEECWFSRWEVLYHQVRLAAALTGISSAQEGDLSSSDIMWSDKEVREVELRILTSPSVLYDPFIISEQDDSEGAIADNNFDPNGESAAHDKETREDTDEEDTSIGRQCVTEDDLFCEATQPIQHFSRVEEEEEDYGEMIPFTESKYKITGPQFYDTSQSSSESDDSSDFEGRFELLSSIPRPHARPRRPSHDFFSASEPEILEEDDEVEDLDKMDVDDEKELSDQLENMIIY